MQHLKDLYGKKGEDFINKLFQEEVSIYLKVDGCLDKETFIDTNKGKITIGEICQTKEKDLKVKSFNFDENKIEEDEIVTFAVRENNNDWYEIELENGEILKVTGNHQIFVPKLNVYRKVSDLKENDEIFYL